MADQRHEFVASILARAKGAQQAAGDHVRVLLFDAAHAHAQMLCLDDDGHAQGVQLFHDDGGDLIGHALLHLQSPRVDVHESGQF